MKIMTKDGSWGSAVHNEERRWSARGQETRKRLCRIPEVRRGEAQTCVCNAGVEPAARDLQALVPQPQVAVRPRLSALHCPLVST